MLIYKCGLSLIACGEFEKVSSLNKVDITICPLSLFTNRKGTVLSGYSLIVPTLLAIFVVMLTMMVMLTMIMVMLTFIMMMLTMIIVMLAMIMVMLTMMVIEAKYKADD